MARAASEISLLDAVEAIEGPFNVNICVSNPPECPLAHRCSVRESWVRAQEVLVEQLRGETFDRLAQRERAGACRRGESVEGHRAV